MQCLYDFRINVRMAEGLKFYIKLSSVESCQEGAIDVKKCSVEDQKGAIVVFCTAIAPV